MKISYIVPVYNGSASISKCLDHIVEQSGKFDREIIIINDGSTDNTVEMLKEKHAIVYNRPHLGVACARNFGMSKATGDYIALIDADSRLDKVWTERCLLEVNSGEILLTTDINYHEEDPFFRKAKEKIQKNPYVSYDNLIGLIGNCTFIPRDLAHHIRYDEDFIVGGEDHELMYRLIDKGLKMKVVLGPSFIHKHAHRSQTVRYVSFARKKIIFAYGNVLAFIKHPYVKDARTCAFENIWVLPLMPFIYSFVKIRLFFITNKT